MSANSEICFSYNFSVKKVEIFLEKYIIAKEGIIPRLTKFSLFEIRKTDAKNIVTQTKVIKVKKYVKGFGFNLKFVLELLLVTKNVRFL